MILQRYLIILELEMGVFLEFFSSSLFNTDSSAALKIPLG